MVDYSVGAVTWSPTSKGNSGVGSHGAGRGHTLPPEDVFSVLTCSLCYFGNAIPARGKDGNGSAGHSLRDPLDGFLKIRGIGEVHHPYLFGRKTFSDMDDLKFFSQFLEVNNLHDVGEPKGPKF